MHIQSIETPWSKGLYPVRFVDYYLGEGMTDPPKPNITYPDGCAGCAGAAAAGSLGRRRERQRRTSGAGGGPIVSSSTPSPGGSKWNAAGSGGQPRERRQQCARSGGGAGMAGTAAGRQEQRQSRGRGSSLGANGGQERPGPLRRRLELAAARARGRSTDGEQPAVSPWPQPNRAVRARWARHLSASRRATLSSCWVGWAWL